jgi:signal transduction histidine kinase
VKRLSHDRRVLLLALLAALPAVLTAVVLLFGEGVTPKVRWTFSSLIVLWWLGCAYALRERVVTPLQTVSNLLAAMREQDFSIRARGSRPDDPLGEVLLEVNALASTLRQQRLGALEATALLSKVMGEIDVAVFAFDDAERLKLTNRYGEKLLGQAEPRLLNRSAGDLGLASCLEGPTPRLLDATFGATTGRWEVRTSTFRQGGLPHRLLVLTDVSRPLREEERLAWQRLIRVLGHEINNSLAPIHSIAGSLERVIAPEVPPPDWRDDVRRGLTVIASRAEALSRFTGAYAKLARLPAPRFAPVDAGELVRRVAGLETRMAVRVSPGPGVGLSADADQVEQLLINLSSATDAALETAGVVEVGWRAAPGDRRRLEIWVSDEGPGLAASDVNGCSSSPADRGGPRGLALENRQDRPGCIAHPRPVHRPALNADLATGLLPTRSRSDTVRSVTTSPVLSVVFGSSSRICASCAATGLCSTPFGITTNSPGSRTRSPSRRQIVSRPSRTRKSSSSFSWRCQTNSPRTFTSFTWASFNSPTIFGLK